MASPSGVASPKASLFFLGQKGEEGSGLEAHLHLELLPTKLKMSVSVSK